MERLVWLVRHGESASNAGEASRSAGCTSLSGRGAREAEKIADTVVVPPDLIVTSPYRRTEETAAPLIRKFPDIRREVWEIQEFTFLGSEHYFGKTQEDRRLPARKYWQECDPDVRQGKEAETFREFMGRVDAFITQLMEGSERFVVCFTHGYVIKAVLWRLRHKNEPVSRETMRSFQELHAAMVVRNGEVFPFTRDGELSFEGETHHAVREQLLD